MIKITLAAIVLLLVVQDGHWGMAGRVARDAPAKPSAEDVGKAIDEAVEAVKTGFESVVKSIQENDLIQNLTGVVMKLGEDIQTRGKDLVEKIQSSKPAADPAAAAVN